jgi:hypothetical protein
MSGQDMWPQRHRGIALTWGCTGCAEHTADCQHTWAKQHESNLPTLSACWRSCCDHVLLPVCVLIPTRGLLGAPQIDALPGRHMARCPAHLATVKTTLRCCLALLHRHLAGQPCVHLSCGASEYCVTACTFEKFRLQPACPCKHLANVPPKNMSLLWRNGGEHHWHVVSRRSR